MKLARDFDSSSRARSVSMSSMSIDGMSEREMEMQIRAEKELRLRGSGGGAGGKAKEEKAKKRPKPTLKNPNAKSTAKDTPDVYNKTFSEGLRSAESALESALGDKIRQAEDRTDGDADGVMTAAEVAAEAAPAAGDEADAAEGEEKCVDTDNGKKDANGRYCAILVSCKEKWDDYDVRCTRVVSSLRASLVSPIRPQPALRTHDPPTLRRFCQQPHPVRCSSSGKVATHEPWFLPRANSSR